MRNLLVSSDQIDAWKALEEEFAVKYAENHWEEIRQKREIKGKTLKK